MTSATTSPSQESAPIKKSLLRDVGSAKLFLTFIFACFLGTVVETIWCILRWGTIESRAGLVYGPFNLVYGFGALLMLLLLYRLEKPWAIFVGSALIGGAFEYFCSVFQELSFGTVSWHYEASSALSLHGRINVLYMFFWGALGLVFLEVLFPRFLALLDKFLSLFSTGGKRVFITALAIFMVSNALISFAAVWRQSQRRQGVAPRNQVEALLDRRFTDERLKKIFPNMLLKTEEGTESLWEEKSPQ